MKQLPPSKCGNPECPCGVVITYRDTMHFRDRIHSMSTPQWTKWLSLVRKCKKKNVSRFEELAFIVRGMKMGIKP